MLALSGYLWALAAILCWGSMFSISDILMKDGTLLPASVGMLRYTLSFPLLLLIGCTVCGTRAMFPRRLTDWLLLSILGLIGSAAMALLLFIAQATIDPVNASLLESYVPMQVLLLGLLTGSRTSLRQVLNILLGFFGTLLVLQALDLHGLHLASLRQGDLLTFLSGLCWAIYTVWGRPLATRLGGFPFTTWTLFFGALWLLLYHVLCGTVPTLPHTRTEWLSILFLALFPTAIAFFGWNHAQKRIPLHHLSFMEYLTPLVAATTSALLGRGSITPFQWLGITIVIASALLQEKEPK